MVFSVTAGDFNAFHITWQTAATRDRGTDIAEWGNTIDLAFSNIQWAETTVENHLQTTSDHFILSITLPTRPKVPAIPTRKKVDDEERFLEVITEGTRAISPSRPDDIPALDKRSEGLTSLLQTAIDASCKTMTARRAFTRKEIRAATARLRKITRKTKRDFRRKQINGLWRLEDIFRITRWTKGSSQFCPPPPEFDNNVYETQLQKAEEAGDATTSTGNTSSGADNSKVGLLKNAWPVVGELIRQLYEQCPKIGYHPKCFKHAEVVMIPKLGKRNLSSPRSWRPISLLSCLGKGRERLIARRMTYASVTRGVVHPRQIGALPKRSAVGLVASLTKAIEQTVVAGKVIMVSTADVQVAFNAVMRNRLTLRLRQQGWPDPVSRWAASFMTDRYARIRLQGTLTEDARLNCGLPQGSSASPILFLLHTQPVPYIRSTDEVTITQSIKAKFVAPAQRFSYADDTAMIRTGNSLEETAALVTMDLENLFNGEQRTASPLTTQKLKN
ncbi:reverse transcriptase [Fusarium albosuccineum]|uniref:Reverse transcriptase n=1 Tax=Fusarium albosuccineum TaxID=1237068 RepID=A0A8H4PK36_9HYPO|nr:reverse transcriptase [Fusarium albosuccineum]